ncbi:glycosyltransferase [Streptomyces chartreusis]|uniref:D-inositol 3-phosphate glycosyltransferase n=1 Tax=Streptomyces chartreusis NRRL 3882 TaxID=1079985 RepID=A0A2N9B3C4_STRCX|nr:glycosyltransferase [Streptomyces chartreusis]SOR77835.1 glycogen/starch synthase, ADP-glucose type [Streptomyces chartreusis NRRL 3882]
MRIVECHYEFTGFDDSLVRAGTSVYLWNLVRKFRDAGHDVSAVTPAHGLLGTLAARHPVEDLPWELDEEVPVRLDPCVWNSHPETVRLRLSVRASRITVDGIPIVFLSGGLLDLYSDALYPPAEHEGKDIGFLKPLAFQIAAARYLADRESPGTVVHLHEPRYHYLLPAALAGRGLTVVSTVQTNHPVNMKVYGPEVRGVLEHLGADASVTDGLVDPPLDSYLHRAMRAYLPRTALYADQSTESAADHVSTLAVVLRAVAALDFLSEGQMQHLLTQGGTPFEQLFAELAVARELRRYKDRLVVCGCAIGDEWLTVERTGDRRRRTLGGLGLDPGLPTIYHAGRYALQHKGQKEVFRAVARLLDDGVRCNVLLHCLTAGPLDDADLTGLASRYPDLVRVRTEARTTTELMDWALASDLSVFPSKFELDTFVMAMGEAMSAGTIPVATAQRGMAHFQHAFDLESPGAAGLAVRRSFRVDDPLLTQEVYEGLRHLVKLMETDPERVSALRARAVAVARRFTWDAVARRFLTVFDACLRGEVPSAALATSFPEPGKDAPSAERCGTAVPERDHVLVRWDDTEATQVEVVFPGSPPEVVALDPQPDGSFAGHVPHRGASTLAVLVTRYDGGAAWAELAVS